MSKEATTNPSSGTSNTIGHTVITTAVITFAGLGMLKGTVPFVYFIVLSSLACGWVPVAVVVGAIQLYLRAVHSMPPNVALTGVAVEPPRAATTSIIPPPGTAMLAMLLGGAAAGARISGVFNSIAMRAMMVVGLVIALSAASCATTGAGDLARAREHADNAAFVSKIARGIFTMFRDIIPEDARERVTAVVEGIDNAVAETRNRIRAMEESGEDDPDASAAARAPTERALRELESVVTDASQESDASEEPQDNDR